MSRDPQSLVLEYEYWRQILTDLQELIELPCALADQALQISTTAVILAQMIEARLTSSEQDLFMQMTGKLRETMRTAKELQDKLVSMGDLVGGRLKAIQAEQGVDGG